MRTGGATLRRPAAELRPPPGVSGTPPQNDPARSSRREAIPMTKITDLVSTPPPRRTPLRTTVTGVATEAVTR